MKLIPVISVKNLTKENVNIVRNGMWRIAVSMHRFAGTRGSYTMYFTRICTKSRLQKSSQYFLVLHMLSAVLFVKVK